MIFWTSLSATVFIVFAAAASASSPVPMSLTVDARDAPRRLLHSEQLIPVRPGPLTLVYPRWAIPTYEAPKTILNDIVGLKFVANGKQLDWNRGPLDMFSFRLIVPTGATQISVTMDVTAAPGRTDFNAMTGQVLILDWNTVLLYPENAMASKVQVRPRLRLPVGWQQASSLQARQMENGDLEFPVTTLTALVDSPVLAGKYLSRSAVHTTAANPVNVNIAADIPDSSALSGQWQKYIERVVNEAGALFGKYPYDHYDFLLTLSEEVGNDGVEHRQSNDIRMALQGLSGEANRLAYGYLLPHEYVHAWNGKFRIPAGLVRRNFQESQTTELLWVYEGLTRYLNWVLAARSGILSVEESQDYAALLAAKVTHRSGRDWRSLQDTAVSTGMLIEAPDQWESLRRGTDYYDEALFIWLEADVTIRRLTQGQRSLDDFCRVFFGSAKPPPDISPYDVSDIVAAMNSISAHDWLKFFRSRLDVTGVAQAPLAGLAASGWVLAYESTPGTVQAARDQVNHTVEERFSLGFRLQDDGTIVDVVRDSPAWKAGLWPGMKIQTVDTQPWSVDALRAAIASGRLGAAPLRISAQNGAESIVAFLDDHQGARYPKLRRNGQEDIMGEILKPKAAP